MPSRLADPPCYAVAGSPILGSLSAPLYRMLFARLGLQAQYTRLAVSSAEEALGLAEDLGLSGFNATSPIKQALPPLLQQLSPAARAAGAVNTVVRGADGWSGDNTDVSGVSETLAMRGVSPGATRVSVLGAGGAARAVLVALARSGFRQVEVCSRASERSRSIERDLGVRCAGLDRLEATLAASDLVISCVPGDPCLVPAAWLRPGMWVLDADYRARGLERAATLAGCRLIPGSDWLALQAGASCEAFLASPMDSDTRSWLCALAAQPRPVPRGPVVLVGFSGAGKSTVGAILARLLGRAFVDTDREVERQVGVDIRGLFAQQGEAAFRVHERRAVARALSLPNAVVALGGGALLHPDTLHQLEDHGLCVLLQAPLATCVERAGDGRRPMLAAPGDAPRLWEQRRPGYLACAELVVATAGRSPEQVSRLLASELEVAGCLDHPARAHSLQPGSAQEHSLRAPRSKSHGIRLLCAAALAPGRSVLERPPGCADFHAALGICEALGARIEHREHSLAVYGTGGVAPPRLQGTPTVLDCGESALCLRLFACVAAALGGPFLLEVRGSLRRRGVGSLLHALRDLGVRCTADGDRFPLRIEGPMTRDRVLLDASGSSQVLTGLLMAAPLVGRAFDIQARGLVSRPYVDLTLEVLRSAGVEFTVSPALDRFTLSAGRGFRPLHATVDCDWSALAFLLVAGATTGRVQVQDVDLASSQGDMAVLEVLRSAGAELNTSERTVTVGKGSPRAFRFDATHHPDLFPPLAALAAACPGRSELLGVGRLRNKESDRAQALQQELGALGILVELVGDRMFVTGSPVQAAAVDAHGDHRIAMALAVAALRATGPCELTGAEHVNKSYPRFFHDLSTLCEGPA